MRFSFSKKQRMCTEIPFTTAVFGGEAKVSTQILSYGSVRKKVQYSINKYYNFSIA